MKKEITKWSVLIEFSNGLQIDYCIFSQEFERAILMALNRAKMEFPDLIATKTITKSWQKAGFKIK